MARTDELVLGVFHKISCFDDGLKFSFLDEWLNGDDHDHTWSLHFVEPPENLWITFFNGSFILI